MRQDLSPELIQLRLDNLRSRVRGRVILPGDSDYDEARQAWNLTVEQRPEVIVAAENTTDIVEAVRYARMAGLGIAVMATGHGVARPADGGLLIITSRLKGVRIDAETRTAWVEAGTQWGDVLEKAQAVGLAPLLGSSPGVGAIGYTLGGGIGWLARKYGLASDSVLFFEVVTADGRLLHVSPSQHNDLFWALCGGGGSFGIVTGMKIRLYPVTTVYAGNLFYHPDDAQAVMARYREWIADAPEELTSSVLLMNFPPRPELPDFLRGQSYVMVRGAYAGPVEQGETLLKFWRDWKAPVIDMFGELPFTSAATISSDPVDPLAGVGTTGWLKNLGDEVIDTLTQYGIAKNGLVVTEVRHVGDGAISRVDSRASAYSNRDESLLLQMVGVVETPEQQRAMGEYLRLIKRNLQPHLSDRIYLNFLEGSEHRTRIRDGYTPENFRQLMVIKSKYDPENVFSYSFNILPARQGEN